jgi:hypothetical protein
LKDCHACNIPFKTYGRYKEPKIMRVYVAGREIFLCPNCRKIWGEWRYKFAMKHGTLTHSKRYLSEVRQLFDLFCRSRKEKVEFT